MAFFLKRRTIGLAACVVEGERVDLQVGVATVKVSGPLELLPTHQQIAVTYLITLPDTAGPARLISDAEYQALVDSLKVPPKPSSDPEPAKPAEPAANPPDPASVAQPVAPAPAPAVEAAPAVAPAPAAAEPTTIKPS